MTECNAASESKAEVAGRGMSLDTAVSMGSKASIVSGSGGATSGERRGNVRLWSCLVWWVRCVANAECAVISLEKRKVNEIYT